MTLAAKTPDFDTHAMGETAVPAAYRLPSTACRLPPTAHCLRFLLAILLAVGPAATDAAEIRLRAQCQSRGPLVTLGDVAEVIAADSRQADSLAAIDLLPAPPPQQQRFVRLREIEDALISRGVNLTEHRFSGSSQVAVSSGGQAAPPVRRPSALPLAVGQKAKQQVRDALVRYLQARGGNGCPWSVEFRLNDDLARALSDGARQVSISGGSPPWTDAQRFEVTVTGGDGPARFALEAQVATAGEMVVAVRSLSKGAIIRETDVQLQPPSSVENSTGGLGSLEDAVGKETTRAIAAGQAVAADAVRAPLQVRRGEVITVSARNTGIRVRTTARARDDGSLGDVVSVESLMDRKTYFVRVSGPQEAEIDPRQAAATARFEDSKPARMARR